MSAPISRKKLSDLWAAEFSPHNHCCLCGNHGVIDTRGQVFTVAGFECGAKIFCLCPNGRSLKLKFPDINLVPDYWIMKIGRDQTQHQYTLEIDGR